jgi:hypothetical protein
MDLEGYYAEDGQPTLEELLQIHAPGDMADFFIERSFSYPGPTPDSCRAGAQLTVKTISDAMTWISHWDVVVRTLPNVSNFVWRNMLFGIVVAADRLSAGDLTKYFSTYSRCINQSRTPVELWRAAARDWTTPFFDEHKNAAPRRRLHAFLAGTKNRKSPVKEHPIWMALLERCIELNSRPGSVEDAKIYAEIVVPLYMGPGSYDALRELGVEALDCAASCLSATALDLPGDISMNTP